MVLGELGGGEWRSRPAGEARRCRRSLRISPKAKGGSAVGVESRELIIRSAAMSPGLRGRWPG